jgi:hypothetical protein
MLGGAPLGTLPLGSTGGHNYAGSALFRGSNCVPNQNFPNPGRLIFGGGQAVTFTAKPRVSWLGVEALHVGRASALVTWLGVEALHVGVSSALVTWTGVEVLRTTSTIPTISAVTWMGAEVAHIGAASERITWVGAEVAHAGAAADRVSWLGVEVLRSVKDRPADSGWVCLIAA